MTYLRYAFLMLLATIVVRVEPAGGAEKILDRVISRESPLLNCRTARLTVGRDGMIYLASGADGKGYVLRMARDGASKAGGEVVYAMHNATANAGGIIATANAHFNHAVNVYDAVFLHRAAANDFLVNDQVQWDAPLCVEAGAGGDFYGVDQHRNRVLRVGADGKVKAVYPIRAEGEGDWGRVNDLRVCEPQQAFYWLAGGNLHRTGFDGRKAWSAPSPVSFRWDVGGHGGWDVDDAGTVYLLEAAGRMLRKLSSAGQPAGEVQLDMGDAYPAPAEHVTALRIAAGDAVVKCASETELFQVYDLATGARKHVASIEHERLTVTLPPQPWRPGAALALEVQFSKNGRACPPESQPRWRVWAAPWGTSDWTEWPRRDGAPPASIQVCVPNDAAGLYQVKVSPETQPRQAGAAPEYLVREAVEIGEPEAVGTAAIVTPLNRTHFARGEAIVGKVLMTGLPEALEKEAKDAVIRLRREGSPVALLSFPLPPPQRISATDAAAGPQTPVRAATDFSIAAQATAALRPGNYRLELEGTAPGVTHVAQPLVIGPGRQSASPFRTTLYGDYHITFPQRNAWQSADAARTHVERMQRLGINQFVNRANWAFGLDFDNTDDGRGLLNRLTERLKGHARGLPWEKAELGAPHHAVAAAYGAAGMREWLLLVNMDGGLPLGTGFDQRKPEEFAAAIRRYTQALSDYPAFEGWTWAANWWLYDPNAKFASPAECAAYEAAMKTAREMGRWDPILDAVEDRKFAYAVDVQEQFDRTLRELEAEVDPAAVGEARGAPAQKRDGTAPGPAGNGDRRFRTAGSGPYRRPEVLPPVNFANVDEVDIHYQAEQIATPDWTSHAVDFMKRPGQPAWTHPELWNDMGTGEQILPASWLAVMRGADGVGMAGHIPNWENVPTDARSGYHGTASVFRAMNSVLAEYGPWLTTLGNGDRVGIVVSPRQMKIETFGNGLGSVPSRGSSRRINLACTRSIPRRSRFWKM